MNGSWKDLLSFNARERNGIFVLALLIVSVIFVQILIPFFIEPAKVTLDEAKILDAYVEQLKLDSAKWVAARKLKYKKRKDSIYNHSKENSSYAENYENTSKKLIENEGESSNWNPHKFNPNMATSMDWKSVGLNDGQIKSINNYLMKGGVFKRVKDVEKMYVINKLQYEKMKPYLELAKLEYSKNDSSNHLVDYQIKEVATKVNVQKKKSYELDSFSIELNTADTIQLKRIRGIGSYYARQIIYYREKLGGFYSTAQLYEVERMRDETVLKMLPFIKVDASLVTKIHINTDIAPKMVKHPYMTWNMAISIQDHRDFSRKFKSVDDLVKKGLLNEELYSKLAPYLEL